MWRSYALRACPNDGRGLSLSSTQIASRRLSVLSLWLCPFFYGIWSSSSDQNSQTEGLLERRQRHTGNSLEASRSSFTPQWVHVYGSAIVCSRPFTSICFLNPVTALRTAADITSLSVKTSLSAHCRRSSVRRSSKMWVSQATSRIPDFLLSALEVQFASLLSLNHLLEP